MPTTLETSLDILQKHYPELQNEFHVKRMGVFGSVSSGKDRADSDIDILVEFEETPDIFEFMRLEKKLQDLLGRPVDLATPNALKAVIKDTILQQTVYV